MRPLIYLFLLWNLASGVEVKQGVYEGIHGYHPYQQVRSSSQGYQPSSAAQKFVPAPTHEHTVEYHQTQAPVSNYHVNQQFPTSQHPEFARQATADATPVTYSIPQVGQKAFQPEFVGHPYPQQQQHVNYNQYSVVEPSTNFGHGLNQGGYNFYIPLQQPEINKYFQYTPAKLAAQPTSSTPQIQPVLHQVKSKPLFNTQVYHPLHTSVKIPQQPESPRLSPPTPPKFYSNFHPMLPKQTAPVTEEKRVEEKETEDEKAEVNDEQGQDEENEKIEEEEDDRSNYKQEEESDEEEYFRPSKYRFSGRFHHDDDDDHQAYRHHEDHEDDDHDAYRDESHSHTSESRPEYSKLSSKYKYPKDDGFKSKSRYYDHKNGYRAEPDCKKPKVEIKMYKYTKSMKNPNKKEYIEGKGSENIPVVEHNQKSFMEQWVVTSKSSSNTNMKH